MIVDLPRGAPVAPGDRTGAPAGHLVRSVISAGIAAPSAENLHLVRFRLGTGGFRLRATDPNAGHLPHRRWLASISHGAMAENMQLRAAELGLGLTVQWLPEPGNDDQVAEFTWTASAAADPLSAERAAVDPLTGFIQHRRTNRRFYRRTQVHARSLARLEAAAAGSAGSQLVWLEQSRRTAALRAIRVAETERFARPELHREMFGAIRFDGGWRAGSDEGLPLSALEVEAPSRPMFAAMRHWPLMRAMQFAGGHHALGVRSGYLPAALAPHLGLICSAPGVDPALAAFEAGRGFQRVWLQAAAEGVAFQPIAAPTTLALQTTDAPGWVAPKARRLLADLLEQVCPAGIGTPQMLFRIGYAAAPGGSAGRLPAERYID